MEFPDDQEAFDAEIAEEVREHLCDWLATHGYSWLEEMVERAEAGFSFGRMAFGFESDEDLRTAVAHRVLLAEGLCCVCNYLVPLMLARSPVPLTS